MIKEINGLEMFNDVLAEGLNVIDFYTDYCVPCKELEPILHKLSEKYNTVNFLKIEATKNREISKKFRVMSAPTIVFYKNGEIVNILHGLRNEEQLDEEINNNI